MAVTRAGRGRRVWEVELIGRLAMPVVISVGVGVGVVPPFGVQLGVLRGVAISVEVRSEP